MSALQLSAVPAFASTPVAGSGFGFAPYATGFGDELVGIAFQPSTGAMFVTDKDGHLWRTPAGGGAATDLGILPKTPRGLTFGLDGKMYVARYDNGMSGGAGDIVEVDPSLGTVLRTVVTRACSDGLATDPLSGDLILTTCRQMFRVTNPGSTATSGPLAPSLVSYASVFNAHAIQITSSGQVFVNAPTNATSCAGSCSNDRSGIWDVTGGGAAFLRNVPGTNGIALVGILATPSGSFPHFVFTNSLTGDVLKVNLDTAGADRSVLTGAGAGDLMTIGPDNCLYAIHGSTVNRIAKSDGSCNLETAGETIPDLDLGTPPVTQRIGTPYTLTATMTGISEDPAALVMLFDVVGANPAAGLVGTWIGGSAAVGWGKWSVTYTGTNLGTDTITARTTHLSLPVTSDPLPVEWGPAADTTPPVVKVKVTGPHGATGFSCAALDAFVEIAVAETCGFFTGAPTIEWQILEPESPATVTGICPTQTLNYPSPATGTPFTCSVGSEGGSTAKTMTLQTAPVAPDVTVIAKTASNAPYVAGVPTRESVIVVFTCKAAYGPPFMTCGSAGATFSGASVVIPPAPPGGCTTVACLPYTIVTATHTFTMDGTFSASASVSDATSRSDSESFGPVIIDKTAPAVSATPSRAPDLAGWYSADVTLTWSCVDSGVVVTGCTIAPPASQLVSGEGDVTYSKTAQDGVGNVGTGTFRVKLDKTAPTVTASATANGLPYTAGALTRFDVVVTFACTDNAGGSGVATCPAPVTVTSASPGVSATGTDVAGNISAPATFGPIVIDNVPPTISAAPDRGPDHNGWYTAPVTITFTCSADALACPSPGTISTDGAGQSRSGTASDLAGNTATATAGGISLDQQQPTLTASLTPAANGAGWHKTDVTVTFSCADQAGLSGIASCLGSTTLGEGADQMATGTATDVAGNTRTLTLSNIDVDKTLPTITASPDRVPNADGWYSAPVVVTFSCSDALSGIASCPSPVTVGHAGAGATGTAVDVAGNSRSITLPLSVDTAAPSGAVTFVGTLADPVRYAVSVQATITGTDALSGVKGMTYSVATRAYTDLARTVLSPTATTTIPLTSVVGASATFTLSAPGESVITFAVTDLAGNTFADTRTVTVVDTIPTTTTLAVRTLRDGRIEATATVLNGTIPVPAGLQVIFTTAPAGTGPATETTNASGVAVATLTRAPGAYTVTATFPEQMPYLTSAATKAAIAAAGTSFVIWGGNAGGVQVGQRVQFWGSDWHQQIADRKSVSYKAAGSFKGYAQTLGDTAFAARTGSGQREEDGDYDEKDRRIRDLPTAEYVTVAITTEVAKQGKAITGNVVGYAILRVEPTKHGRYDERAFGVVVAIY